jgi:glutamate-1-semialdehyde 2,1-aminomutase
MNHGSPQSDITPWRGNARSQGILEHNRQFIPGGVVSLNRLIDPVLCFVRGQGAEVWDADGNRYIDYHAAFAPFLLGHNHPAINRAVIESLQGGETLMGAGPTAHEGELAELICRHVPSAEGVQLTNTGSEATYHALRIARAHTGRDDVIVMQGGYNGWHNDVAVNVMTPLDQIGPRVSPGEYPVVPLSAGIPPEQLRRVHVVNFNDLDSIEYCCRRYPIGCLISEPILQNIGVVKPQPGYLEGVRTLADRYGFVFVMDEVKTGFRHALGGYQSLCGVKPDLCVFGKAIANGYPMGVIAGRRDLLDYFVHPDPRKKVLIAGTYNAHPTAVIAAITTLKLLAEGNGAIHRQLETRGAYLQAELEHIFAAAGITVRIARQGSAFCVYFMDHLPVDWHDVATHHDFAFDTRYRRALIERGVFHFPLPTKQGSLSSTHTDELIAETLRVTREVVAGL